MEEPKPPNEPEEIIFGLSLVLLAILLVIPMTYVIYKAIIRVAS